MNITKCQVCDSPDLQMVFDVGWLPAVNVMRKVGEPSSSEPFYPAQLFLCGKCQLVQLGHQAKPEDVFPPGYSYRSSCTRALLDNFDELVKECSEFGLPRKEPLRVIDVGCNDGSLLKKFKKAGFDCYGIEPTNAAEEAKDVGLHKGIYSVRQAPIGKYAAMGWKGWADFVTACNVFAHMPDVHDALDCVLEMLADDGVFVIETHYLMTLLSKNQFDTIYHEHCRYYSLTSLKHLLEMHGMEVLRCKQIPTHGGSIRVYAARKGKHKTDQNTLGLLYSQYKEGCDLTDDFRAFRVNCQDMKLRLYQMLYGEFGPISNSMVYGIGAPSRATTLIHYCGLDHGILSCVCEQTGSKKIGCTIPGTTIEIVDEAKLYQDQPPYAVILSWHLADEIIGKLKAKGYRGRFIVPLPYPRIVK